MPLPTTTGVLEGTLKIGTTGTLIDVSCLANNVQIVAEKNSTDPTVKVGGCVRPGTTAYTYKMTGNTDTDIGDEAGLFALSWADPGQILDYEFTASDVQGTKFVGQLVIDPLAFGAGEAGGDLVSDFEFILTDKPVITYPVAV